MPTGLVHKGLAVASAYSSLIAIKEAGASVGAFTSGSPTPAERRGFLGGRLEAWLAVASWNLTYMEGVSNQVKCVIRH